LTLPIQDWLEMSFLGLFGFAVKGALSHRSRSVGSILGTIVAVSFIVASVMSVDTIASKKFASDLEEAGTYLILTKGDFDDPLRVNSNIIDVDQTIQKLSDIDGIDLINGKARTNFYIHRQLDGNASIGYPINALMNETFESGNVYTKPALPGQMIVNSEVASEMNLSVGDTFNVTLAFGGPWWGWDALEFEYNTSLNVFAISDNFSSFSTTFHVLSYLIESLLHADLPFDYPIVEQTIEIRISRDYFRDIEDPYATHIDIMRLINEIGTVINRVDYRITENEIEELYEDYLIWSWTTKILFIALTTPLLLISFYLILAGSKVDEEEKMREIGGMKIKGASRGQLIYFLAIESIFYGLIGGTIGLFIGSVVSVLFDARIFGLDPTDRLLQGKIPIPDPYLMFLALVIVPTIIIVIRAFLSVRIAHIPILESLGRARSARSEKRYDPKVDAILLSITLFVLGLTFYFRISDPDTFLDRLFLTFNYYASPIVVLFLPFLLVLTVSRILILGFDSIIDGLSSIGKVIVKDLYPLFKANLRFNRRKIATLIILVTSVVAFGTFVSSMEASRIENVQKTVAASIPTEIMVVADGRAGDNFAEIESADRIEWAVEIDTYSETLEIPGGDLYTTMIVAFDSANYSRYLRVPGSALIEGEGPKSLRSPGRIPVLINEAVSVDTGISVGEVVRIHNGSEWLDLVIVGIVSYLPGTRSTIGRGAISDPERYMNLENPRESKAIYIDSGSIPTNYWPRVRTFLIGHEGDESGAISALNSVNWNGSRYRVLLKDDETDKIVGELSFRSIQTLLEMEYVFVAVGITSGILLLMVVSTYSNRREYAELIARGGTRGHIVKLVLTEGVSVLIAGLILGTVIGFVIAFTFQDLYTDQLFRDLPRIADTDLQTNIQVDPAIVFPASMFWLHLIASACVVGSSLVAGWLASKVDVASSLRLRIR
jgi:ABC-type lipoprotein release transport system permease subunit